MVRRSVVRQRREPVPIDRAAAPVVRPGRRAPIWLASSEEMRALDRQTIAAGTSSLTLMERAGESVWSVIRQRYPDVVSRALVVLCGPGNNGGDGLVIARLALRDGLVPEVFVAAATSYSADFLVQLERYRSLGGRAEVVGVKCVLELPSVTAEDLRQHLGDGALVVDALLGTGATSAPRGAIAECLFALRDRSAALAGCVAVDVPTGVNADTGEVFEPHVVASDTVCIELMKRGLWQEPARSCCGQMLASSIGIETAAGTQWGLLDLSTAPRVAARRAAAHKGSFGRVFVLGGSQGMPGAPLLAGHAALRTGAGVVTVASPGGILGSTPPELLFRTVPGTHFSQRALPRLQEDLDLADVIAIGPGLSTHRSVATFFRGFLKWYRRHPKPLVLDADALNLLAKDDRLAELSGMPVILTPHPGEAARLLHRSVVDVQRDRFAAVLSLARHSGATIVLKGAYSLIATGNKGAVNTSGNPYMATAGSGDVLTGVIAGLLAQGLAVTEAAQLGAYLHGAAGDRVFRELRAPMLASDITAALPYAMAPCIE